MEDLISKTLKTGPSNPKDPRWTMTVTYANMSMTGVSSFSIGKCIFHELLLGHC